MNNLMPAVEPWPASRPFFLKNKGSEHELIVISVATPAGTIRHVARQRVRDALRDLLGILLDCPPATVPLVSHAGHALHLDLPGRCIGLSVSHQPGLTLAAIQRCGPVGIDLMQVADGFDWQPIARDYLGPQAYDRIARKPAAQQPHAFAMEWTGFEAALKCLGLALAEWNPALAHSLAGCRTTALVVPDGFVGTVAVMRPV